MEIKSGDFFMAYMPFADSNTDKLRPVLVLEVQPWGCQVAYCTTQKLCKAFASEVVLTTEDAQKVGLNGASRIDFGKRARIATPDFVKKVGSLGMPGENLSMQKFREIACAANAAGI